ncbi:MAG: tetratricopeptide repeat protein, partial [Vulcanimicrobiaceae bacterium]
MRLRGGMAFAAMLALVVLAGSFLAVAQSRARPYPALSNEAARAYTLGHYYWDKRTLDGTHRALAYYEDVIRLASHSPLGYVGLAEAYLMIANHGMVRGDLKQYYARAEAYARLALERDPQSGEALAIIGFIHQDRDMHFAQAERELRQAVALQPAFAEAQEFLGSVLFDEGKIVEAHEHFARAAALDPLSAPILRFLGISNYYAHDFIGAKRALRQALDLDRTEEEAAWYLIRTEEQLGEVHQAATLLAQEHARISGMKNSSSSVLQLRALRALIALKAGDRRLAVRIVPELKPTSKPGHDIDVALLAAVNYQLGRRDDAVAWLRAGLRHNRPQNLR